MLVSRSFVLVFLFALQLSYLIAQDEEGPDEGTPTEKPPTPGGGDVDTLSGKQGSMLGIEISVATIENDVRNPENQDEVFKFFSTDDLEGLLHLLHYNIDVWLTLQEKLKFRLVFVFPDRRKDSYDYLKTMVSDGRADVTLLGLTLSNETLGNNYAPPIDVGKYKLFVKTPTSEAAWSSLGDVFRPALWVATAVAIFFMALILIAIEHLGYKAKIPKYLEAPADTGQLFMIILGNFCYQGGLNIASGMSGKVVSLTGLITGYLIYISYSTLVISQLTAVKVVPPFESLQEMARKDIYKLYVSNDKSLTDDIETVRRNKSNALASTWDKLLPPKLGVNDIFTDELKGLTKLCASPSAILALDNKITTKQQSKAKCSATPLKPTYFKTYMGFVFKKGFKYYKVFSRSIFELREFGIIKRLRDQWDFYDGLNQPSEKSAAKVKPITLATILPVIAIVAVGIGISIVVLIIEISYKTFEIYYSNKRKENQARMFHRKRKLSMAL